MARIIPNWEATKEKLIQDYGFVCFNCFKKYPRMDLVVHSIYKHKVTYKTCMLMCKRCKEQIEGIPYGSEMYWHKINEIATKLSKHIEYPYMFNKGT